MVEGVVMVGLVGDVGRKGLMWSGWSGCGMDGVFERTNFTELRILDLRVLQPPKEDHECFVDRLYE